MPGAQRFGVALAERLERGNRLLDIGPPFKRAPGAGDERNIEFGFDAMRAVLLECKVAVPRHGGDGALEKGVSVVQDAGMTRIFEGGEPAARNAFALDRQGL